MPKPKEESMDKTPVPMIRGEGWCEKLSIPIEKREKKRKK